jgi:hypothetical protein
MIWFKSKIRAVSVGIGELRVQKRIIRNTALLLTLCYFYLSGALALCPGEHMLMHGGSAHQETQPASILCTWMCAASIYVHTAKQTLELPSNPSFESTMAKPDSPPLPEPRSADTIRPPPFSPA